MKKIPLTQGKFAIVDDDMFEYLNQWKWCAEKTTYDTYIALRAIHLNNKTKKIRMHRVIIGNIKGGEVDHINHNTLDNRKCNLRLCTRSQNSQNRNKQRNCTSQYKGVCWHKRRRKWIVQIKTKKKQIEIGFYESEVEAAKAYESKAKELFGEFAFKQTG